MSDRLLLLVLGVVATLVALVSLRARSTPRFHVVGVPRLPAPAPPGSPERIWDGELRALVPILRHLAARRRVLLVGGSAEVPPVAGGPVYRMDPEDADGVAQAVDALGSGPEVVVLVPTTPEALPAWKDRLERLPEGARAVLLCPGAESAVRVDQGEGGWRVCVGDDRWELGP